MENLTTEKLHVFGNISFGGSQEEFIVTAPGKSSSGPHMYQRLSP